MHYIGKMMKTNKTFSMITYQIEYPDGEKFNHVATGVLQGIDDTNINAILRTPMVWLDDEIADKVLAHLRRKQAISLNGIRYRLLTVRRITSAEYMENYLAPYVTGAPRYNVIIYSRQDSILPGHSSKVSQTVYGAPIEVVRKIVKTVNRNPRAFWAGCNNITIEEYRG